MLMQHQNLVFSSTFWKNRNIKQLTQQLEQNNHTFELVPTRIHLKAEQGVDK